MRTLEKEDVDILLKCIETQANTIKTLFGLVERYTESEREKLIKGVDDSLKVVERIRKDLGA